MESFVVKTNLEFILHVIPPPMRLKWATPRSLFLSTLLNYLRKDLAPIGHLFVEFSLPDGNRVITGMSRKSMNLFESFKVIQGKGLGLGSFFYDFKGNLDSVKGARDEIIWAQKRNRHTSIRVLITEEKSQQMLAFLKEWIERGSFRHYSGGLNVAKGEGSGCAEFGMYFLAMALGVYATHPAWVRKVLVPDFLIGGGLAGHQGRVSMLAMVKDGVRWAHENEPHHVYSTPDPELIFDWINENKIFELSPEVANWSSEKFQQKEFAVNYPKEPMGSFQEQWNMVIEKTSEK